MATEEDIQNQLTLLAAHRRTLTVYLHQQAQAGGLAPPSVENGIAEARAQIARIKSILRQWNVPITEHPDDNEQSTPENSPPPKMRKRVDSQIIAALIAAAATVIVAVIGLVKFNEPNTPSIGSNFQYQVRVEAFDTSKNLRNAKVTIELAGAAPLDAYTDSNGFAQMEIDKGRAGKPARIIVEAVGYQRFEQTINLSQDSLPDVIKLNANP